MFIDIMRKKILNFKNNYPNLAERARRARHRAPASRAVTQTLSDGSDDEDIDEAEQTSFRATDTACKLDAEVDDAEDEDDAEGEADEAVDAEDDEPNTLIVKLTIASAKLATFADSSVKQEVGFMTVASWVRADDFAAFRSIVANELLPCT